jgi:hypothetical protein
VRHKRFEIHITSQHEFDCLWPRMMIAVNEFEIDLVASCQSLCPKDDPRIGWIKKMSVRQNVPPQEQDA